MSLSLSPKQIWSIKRATKRLNLWVGSVRSSKTWATIFKWLTYVASAPKGGDLLIIGKTSRTVYRNIIRTIELLIGNSASYSYGRGEIDIFGKKCFILGANDERSEGIIRGMTCSGCLGDEVTLWNENLFKMLLSRMSVDRSQFFGTTNPDSPNHYLKKEIIDRQSELSLSVFNFKIDDNIFLSRTFIRNIKKEYTGLWYRRFIDGLWCIAEGSIFDFFEEKSPFIYTGKKEAKYKVIGIDYGTGNPTTYGLYGVNHFTKPRIWLEREYWYDSRKEQSQKSDSEYVDDYIEFAKGENILYTIIDPSAASLKVELRNRREFKGIILDANNDVLDGTRTVSKMWKNGEYTIHADCEKSIEETYGYVWDSNAQKRGEDKPRKVNDHTRDRDRYVLHTLFGVDKIDYEQFTRM